jgi:cation transport regulator ChaB
MASMLRPFRIKPHTIRLDGDSTARGFYPKEFNDAWNSYCDGEQPADAGPQEPKLRVIEGDRKSAATA